MQREPWPNRGARRAAGGLAISPRGLLALVLALFVLFAACDRLVTGAFYDAVIAPAYVQRYRVLRDRTHGSNLRIFFDALDRIPRSDTVVAFMGDSTVHDEEAPDSQYLPFLVRAGLQQRTPDTRVHTVDASRLGMFASDAALFATKLFNRGADVVVYALTLRAFHRDATTWVSHVQGELAPGDLRSLAAAGAGDWMLSRLSAEDVAGGLAWSAWAFYAYRAQIRDHLWIAWFRPVLGDDGWLAAVLRPTASPSRVPTAAPHAYEWTRAEYAYPNTNWRALEIVARTCALRRDERCVFYAGPVNPAVLGSIPDARVVDDFVARAREIAVRHGVDFLDLTRSLRAESFRVPPSGRPDAIHPNRDGRARLAGLLIDPLSDVVRAAHGHEDGA